MKFLKHLIIVSLLTLIITSIQAITVRLIIDNKMYEDQYCIAVLTAHRTMMFRLDTRNVSRLDYLDPVTYSVVAYLHKHDNDSDPIEIKGGTIQLKNDGDFVVDAANNTITFHVLAN